MAWLWLWTVCDTQQVLLTVPGLACMWQLQTGELLHVLDTQSFTGCFPAACDSSSTGATLPDKQQKVVAAPSVLRNRVLVEFNHW